MKKKYNYKFHLFILLLPLIGYSKNMEFKVFQFNIWQEGTVIAGGFNAIVEEIIRTDADLVALSEVRNYKNTDFGKRLVKALAIHGKKFYSGKSYDTGIISRYPIESYSELYPCKGDHGSITKAVVNIYNKKIAFYSAHLDYLNCSYYLVRGYSGTTWEELPAPITDKAELLKDSRVSKRDDAIRVFIEDAKKELKNGNSVIIGGDFNEPSHRDWTKETKNSYDHNGVVIEWECTKLLEEAGFSDCYRVKYPDPVKNPGFTFPSYNPDIKISKLTWAPKADERERIDFIFFYDDGKLSLEDVIIVGPDSTILKSHLYIEKKDIFSKPSGVWPTDHKGLLSVFKFKNSKK